MKVKTFCMAKDISIQTKWQAAEHQESKQLKLKWGKGLSKEFSKNETQMAEKHFKNVQHP